MSPAQALTLVFGRGAPTSPTSVHGWQRSADVTEDYLDVRMLARDLSEDEASACRLRYGPTRGTPAKWGEDDAALLMQRVRLPGFQEIAQSMGATPRQVKRLLESARAKVERRLAMRALEESAGHAR